MKYALSSLLLLFFPSVILAGGFNSYGHYGHSYNHGVIVKQKVVEFDADYFLGLKGYVIAGEQAESNSEQRHLLKEQQLSKALELIERLLDERSITGEEPKSGSAPKDEPKPAGDSGPSDPDDKSTELDKKVLGIFFKNCKNCHADDNKSGGIQLFTTFKKDGTEFAKLTVDDDPCKELVKRNLIHDSCNGVGLADRGKQVMPIGGNPLSTEDVEVLRLWCLEQAESIR